MEEEQVLMFEKIVNISEDEDFKESRKKLLSDEYIRWIMSEIQVRSNLRKFKVAEHSFQVLMHNSP